MHAEGIYPEMVSMLRIPRGNVAGNPFIEAIPGKQPERRR
jgi:hypothetical protein